MLHEVRPGVGIELRAHLARTEPTVFDHAGDLRAVFGLADQNGGVIGMHGVGVHAACAGEDRAAWQTRLAERTSKPAQQFLR